MALTQATRARSEHVLATAATSKEVRLLHKTDVRSESTRRKQDFDLEYECEYECAVGLNEVTPF